MANDADTQLQPEHLSNLNKQFYAERPWRYFQQRLTHLALMASDSARYRELFVDGVRVGSVEVTLPPASDAEEPPTAAQSFVAVEAEVLLHHAAETLLRFVHAHAGEDPCPWLRMSRLTRFGDFKDWVRAAIADAADDDLDALATEVLACDPRRPEEVRACAGYLRILARHFLDADPYNAAKHGMALRGAAEQWTVAIDDEPWLDRGGASVSWLARWPREDPSRPARWTRATRIFSVEATVALVDVAAQLMQAVWLRGHERHLDEPLVEVYRPVAPHKLFAAFDAEHHVLVEIFRPLPAEGEQEDLVVRSRHFAAPPSDGSDA